MVPVKFFIAPNRRAEGINTTKQKGTMKSISVPLMKKKVMPMTTARTNKGKHPTNPVLPYPSGVSTFASKDYELCSRGQRF